MTREELKKHCERQVQQFERVEKIMPVTPNDWKRYEEHKLILELLEQETVSKEVYDHEYFLRKEFEIKIARLEHDKNVVLNKIRAEIDKAWCTKPKNRYEEGLKDQALKDMQIIDRYKVESEE